MASNVLRFLPEMGVGVRPIRRSGLPGKTSHVVRAKRLKRRKGRRY